MLKKGDKIQVPTHYSNFPAQGIVQGFRYGQQGFSNYYLIRIDNSQRKKCLKLWAHDAPYCKILK